MKVWEGHTIEGVIIVMEKAVNSDKPKTVNSCRVQMLCMVSENL